MQNQDQDSSATQQIVSTGGKGRNLPPLMNQWAKIIVKISQQRCILFNLFEKRVEKAFSTIRAPDKIKSKASVVLTSNEQMFVIGGEDKGVYLGKNYMFNFVTLEFDEKQPMIEAKVFFGCIYFNGGIFVVGGWKEQYLQKAEVYNISSDSWFSMDPLNDEREDVSLCIVQDKYLFAFGNVTNKGRRAR